MCHSAMHTRTYAAQLACQYCSAVYVSHMMACMAFAQSSIPHDLGVMHLLLAITILVNAT